MGMASFARLAIALPITTLMTIPLATCSSGSSAPAQEGAGADPVVITRADAVTPKAGRDYRVLTTLRGADARRATAVTDDRQILLTRYDHDGQTHVTLLDPRTGGRTKIPSPYHGTDVLEATAREVWYDAGKPMERPHVYHFDRRTTTVRGFVLPDAPGVSEKAEYRILGFIDHRVWFATGSRFDTARDVWSVRFGRPGTIRAEAFDIWKTGRSGDANTPPASGPGAHPIMIWPRGKVDHEEYTRIPVVRWK
jgi:hypothetical protein